ncbi:hypothetical protein FB45DRAFT_1028305 [Roridomyces roridus]|uniref:Uncharacterized protein n=1 Tax=Roridomyces roridus TaxID=1738132 RepID=A0AAD7BUW1_9AGAR|nr:hypothetical protein FB45DRAFT_1028305 [Roridomyces roridus]
MADDEDDPGPSQWNHTVHAPRPSIRFPNPDEPQPSKRFHTSPPRRSSPLANGSAATSSHGRRRVHSVNPEFSMPSTVRARRPVSKSFGSSSMSTAEDSGISLFSDEYDLCASSIGLSTTQYLMHNQRIKASTTSEPRTVVNSSIDPRILQDVQRALKLKARREARLKSANSSPSSNKSEPAYSPSKSPAAASHPSPSPVSSASNTSHSRGGRAEALALPLGTTLDWSGIGGDDDKSERRWSMSISKRKDREKHPSNSAVETRESMYAAKILQIRSKISPSALEKASVVCDQLGRRYNVILDSLAAPTPFNMVKVVRWFGSQEEVVKASLEQAEPFTWLRVPQTKGRNPWCLSALIMEEYLLQLRGSSKPKMHTPRVASLNSSSTGSILSRTPYISHPGSPYLSIAPSLGPSLSRRLSNDHRAPLELVPESGRRSMDRESFKSGESGFSSIRSGSSLHHAISPTSAHFHRIPSALVSENGGSSRNSLSELSDDGGRQKRTIVAPAPLNHDLLAAATAKMSPIPLPSSTPTGFKNSPIKLEGASSSVDKFSFEIPATATGHTFGQRKSRMSMPSTDNLRQQMEQRRQLDADEEQTNRDYERKQQLLEATVQRNARVRQLLQHIAAGVKDYDQIQASLSTLLKVPDRGLPRELVEAFVSGSVLADPIGALTESLKALEAERREIAWKATEVSDVLKNVQTSPSREISTIVALEESYKDQYQYLWEVGMDALTLLLDTVTPFWRTYGRMIGDDVQHFLIIPLYRNEFTGEAKRYTIDKLPRRSVRHWIGLFVFFLITVALTVVQAADGGVLYGAFLADLDSVSYLRRLILVPYWIGIVVQCGGLVGRVVH